MASGHHHDLATKLLAVPFGLCWIPSLGMAGACAAGLGFLLGGLWLSPDLDTRSNATRRWGPLRVLWWPYRMGLTHRSVIPHCPLVGTAGRLAYLSALVLTGSVLLSSLGGPPPAHLIQWTQELWLNERGAVIGALVGVEASSWLHLIQDGDPTPRLPRLRRRR